MVQLDFGPSRYGHSAPVTPCSGMEVIEQCPLLAQSGHREVPKRTSFEPLRYSILPSGQAMRGHEFIKFLGGATAAWPLADTGSYRSGTKHNCCASVTKEVAVFRIRSRFAKLSFVSIVATTFLAGVAMTPAFAQATKLSKADQRLLKHAIASCKSEAKVKKVKLLDRRQFVVDCVQALKDRPQVNVQEVLKNHPD